MAKVIVDEALRNKLRDFCEPVDLYDESGRLLARVMPLQEYEAWEPLISEEELRRREQSNNWHSTEQVLAHLKSLERP